MTTLRISWKEHAASLQAEIDGIARTLPGVFYMDPPDGGSVTLVEQFERMAKDAARWRWMSQNCHPEFSSLDTPHVVAKVCVGGHRNGTGWFEIIGPQAKVGIVTLEQAIDIAMTVKEPIA